MDSYGYQRRLQESQGLVTMQSSPAPAAHPVVHHKKNVHHRKKSKHSHVH